MRLKYFLLIAILFAADCVYADRQNLDESLARKSRVAAGTLYSGEESPSYQWQPESVRWVDTSTSHEVWRLVFQKSSDLTSKEHAGQAWSGDGSRLGFWDGGTRDTIDPDLSGGNSRNPRRWVINTDGSKLKASDGRGLYAYTLSDFDWLHTERASYYAFGSHATLDGQTYILYKSVFDSNNDATNSTILDTSSINSNPKSESFCAAKSASV